jgi:pyruvate/2-oxoglutarate/acetoin dehydrogenase E1 component
LPRKTFSIEIVDLRTLLPLDEAAILETVKKTSKAIVLHEDTLTGGIGGEIVARINEKAFECLDGPVCASPPPTRRFRSARRRKPSCRRPRR